MTISERIRRLEQLGEARDGISRGGYACDIGPYDLASVLQGWHPDAVFQNGEERYEGIEQLTEFFGGLSAPFTFHIFCNFETLATDPDSVTVHTYGLEGPILNGRGHFGAFEHIQTMDTVSLPSRSREWYQSIHLITSVDQGWVDGPAIADQTKSSDDQE